MAELSHEEITCGLAVLRYIGIEIFRKLMKEQKLPTENIDVCGFPVEILDIKDAIRLTATALELRSDKVESEMYRFYVGINDLIKGSLEPIPAPTKNEINGMLSLLFLASAKLDKSGDRRVIHRAFLHISAHYSVEKIKQK